MQKSPHLGPRTGASPASWGTAEARLRKGYECTKILIDILLRGLKGDSMYSAGVALKRKIAFPLFNTIKVCRRTKNQDDTIFPAFPSNTMLWEVHTSTSQHRAEERLPWNSTRSSNACKQVSVTLVNGLQGCLFAINEDLSYIQVCIPGCI